ncbi:NAD(P)-binding protein [Thozetella sp. PMI_491]|nr:NAD(P)-binding protein [Thozetella sp. PMI_491]
MSGSSSTPVVLLTGGRSGLGLSVLTRLLESYDTKAVVLAFCATPELTALGAEYGKPRLTIVYGDACKDVLTDTSVSLESFRSIFNINFFSVVSLVRKRIPHLSKAPTKPTVVIVTSGVDLDVYYRGYSGNCSSKATLAGFIHLLAHEEKNINVFGAIPIVTKSPMMDIIFQGKYTTIEDMIEPPEYIEDAMVKPAMGGIEPNSPEVKRKK